MTIKKDIIEIIVAFVVAWLFYQGLAFALGTNLPIVSVVSQSMYHSASFSDWWEERGSFYEENGITKQEFLSFTLPNGMSRGDLLLVVSPNDIKIGDIILYNRGIIIVHRVIAITENGFITKGDNNSVPDPEVYNNQIAGKVVMDVPALGYPRLMLYVLGV